MGGQEAGHEEKEVDDHVGATAGMVLRSIYDRYDVLFHHSHQSSDATITIVTCLCTGYRWLKGLKRSVYARCARRAVNPFCALRSENTPDCGGF